MMHENQKKTNCLLGVCALTAMFALLVLPAVSNANDLVDVPADSNTDDDINFYHTYHNDLGGKVLTNCQLGVDFMEKYFSLWIDDGEREWYVTRNGLGHYSEYGEGDCKLYTNSFSVRLALYIAGLKHVGGFVCFEQDVQ